MKVRILIKILQEYDSELEVCVGNTDIHFLSKEPSYYDGDGQVLKRDESIETYNIIGAKYLRDDEDKLKIHTLSIRDVIWNDFDVPVECHNREQKNYVAGWRQEAKDFDRELKKEDTYGK